MPGRPQPRPGLPAPLGAVAKHLEPWSSVASNPTPLGPSAAVAAVRAAAVTSPVSGSTARCAL
jgi:hypothetical protein